MWSLIANREASKSSPLNPPGVSNALQDVDMSDESLKSVAVPVFFGGVCFLMGLVILGAQAGVIPTTEGAFFAPPRVITALAIGLMLVALVTWIPARSPAFLRGLLGFLALAMFAVVCNWSAFTPNVRYSTNFQIGPFSGSGEDPIGGRIVFGIVALAIDGLLLGWLAWTIRRLVHK
jgi:hypothetical protein